MKYKHNFKIVCNFDAEYPVLLTINIDFYKKIKFIDKDMENLSNMKTALITGATKGIGYAIAEKFVLEGISVFLVSSNMENLLQSQAKLKKVNENVDVQLFAADLTTSQGIYELCLWAEKCQPNILINNVGLFEPYGLLGEEDGLIEKMFHINYLTAHQLCRTLGRIMKHQGSGHIFNIGSTASRSTVKAASYTVTKFAIRGLSIVLREELRSFGVKVTEIIPGSTLTSSWDGADIPEDRFVKPNDIAKAVYNCLLMDVNTHVDEITITPQKGNIISDLIK